MKKGGGPQPQRSANVSDYRNSFLRRVHQLLKLGYDSLNPARYPRAQEEAITGDLLRAIDNILDDPPPAIDGWADSFWAQEELRVHQKGRRGRRRLRIDISIQSSQVRPRARFHFEAKRLGRRHTVRGYLGADGLGAYLSGVYAKSESDAGMLGYVQHEDEVHWAAKIRNEITAIPNQYGCGTDPTLNQVTLIDGLQFTYSSLHSRAKPLPPIRVYHTLLLFR